MENELMDASWIWYTEAAAPDTYGDFLDCFLYTGGNVVCHVSCDGDYTLFVNGNYVSSNQYADFSHYKIYDTVDITDYLLPGTNTLLFTVWHMGIASSRYKPAKAGLLYKVACDDQILCNSRKETLCRENPNYKNRYGKLITPQLGQSFLFDASKPSDIPYTKSFVVQKDCQMHPRPISKLSLLPEKQATVLKSEGNHYLLDLGEETVGLPSLAFSTKVCQKLTVCWGEHILAGSVRRIIGDRDFSFEYIAKPGRNNYTNYMLRLGCRYLEIFCEAPIELEHIGLIPQVYPVEVIPRRLPDVTDQTIYDLCVNTLKLCMMEHYVDTPWREQAFYSFDSRNQMLCGYRVFQNENRDYVRANLLLISKDDREDGLLSITYPHGGDLVIPSFTLHYFTAVREYLDHTGDLSLAHAVYDKLSVIISTFVRRIRGGLLSPFEGISYWNFYDWSTYMEGTLGKSESRIDLMINCLFVIALENFKIISHKIGKPYPYQQTADELKAAIKKSFFRSECGLFTMTTDREEYTQLGNAVAILAGLTTEVESMHIAEKLLTGELTECSLSMKCFPYDALLTVDPKYSELIKEDIRRNYSVMLENGATSVWEVLGGADAFDKAGSLCHGWSAIPILYL